MAAVALSALLGLFGSFLKPIPFVAALVPLLAAASVMLAFAIELHWLTALGAFYGCLALAEIFYVAMLSLRLRGEHLAGEA